MIERAQQKGMGIIAIKAMAHGKYPAQLPADRRTPKYWYEPTTLPEEATLAYRWTLSRPVTAAIPPGNPPTGTPSRSRARRISSRSRTPRRASS